VIRSYTFNNSRLYLKKPDGQARRIFMVLDLMTLEQMKSVDIRTVDIDTLVDAESVSVDMNLPKIERMLNVASQMGASLYCFRAGRIAIKVSHSKTATASADDRVEGWMRTM
jgi:hypothetical protein